MTDIKDAPRRPRSLSPEMARAVAKDIAAELIAAGQLKPRELDDAIVDIARNGRLYGDGYQLAKDLERLCGWRPSTQMVEILDGFSTVGHEKLVEAQRAWASENNVEPPYPTGTRVLFSWGMEKVSGEITGICDHNAASYRVKRDGDPEAGEPHYSRAIVAFEAVELAP